jgi:CheY-like chemotaxis protein
MSEQHIRVFVVDDDATARLAVIGMLEEPEYSLRECADGPALLAALEEETPDLVLLDIEMPGMDGLAACRAVRAAGHDTLQIVFVSAHNDIGTRLAAYDAGGNDFITKPCEPEELARKIDIARRGTLRWRDLGSRVQDAQRMAFTTMSALGETGVVLEFLRSSFACQDAAALAGKLLDALRQFDLEGLAKMRTSEGDVCFSPQGDCSPLERSIIDHASGMERIFQFRDRLAINYPGVTLLVQHLPIADNDRIGRLRDHLAILVEGADARLQAMETERRERMQASGIGEVLAELTATLDEIDRLQAQLRLQATEIDEAYLEELVGAFVHLGLTDDQERTLADMAERTHKELNALRDADRNSSDRLRAVARRLGGLAQV